MVDHDSLPEELERSSPELPQLVTDPEFRALGPPFRPEGRNQVATIIRDYPPSAIALAAPPMSEAEYQELKDNIAAHGLRNPIVLIGNRILDGLPRLHACKELGIPPRYIEWKSRRRGDSAVAYAAGQHTRRNLSPQQKALYAAKWQI